jgi:flagellar export protein FliJ
MKKFRFKFESVLKIRQTREEEVLRALGAAQRAYQEELAEKQQILSELDQSLKRREKLGSEAVTINSFQIEQNFITGTKQRIIRQDQAIVRASRTVEKALRAYLFARRQTRMIEILRDKDFAEFKKAVAKKEQKELDELSAMRTSLNRQNEEVAS